MTTTQADRPPTTPVDEALAPLREELLAAARRDAAVTASTAAERASGMLAEARAEADRRQAQARAEGEHDAELIRLDQIARARRRARGIVLAAQNDALTSLRRRVGEHIRRAWADPARHEVLLDRLSELARAELGDACEIREHPGGGLVAEEGTTRARYLLTDLADDAIDDLADQVQRLWTPS